ncbi:hypothetical protein CEXT_287371 [Caerostris extrusa]|uniref:Uncharacterized protein n=1 Tax=Caerostris extrusa TaxID=172846 RepID=A0AAV4PX12_CAEEX|nr:hypothetical protein CEXT_287371 [Caerostris extrusa]
MLLKCTTDASLLKDRTKLWCFTRFGCTSRDQIFQPTTQNLPVQLRVEGRLLYLQKQHPRVTVNDDGEHLHSRTPHRSPVRFAVGESDFSHSHPKQRDWTTFLSMKTARLTSGYVSL